MTSECFTALLASFANEVIAIDSYQEYVDVSADLFAKLNLNNISVSCDEPALGYEKQAPYDVIVLLGSMEVMPESLKQQLKVGGRMFCILGKAPAMEAVLIERQSEDRWDDSGLFELITPSIPNAPQAEKFHF